MPIPSLVMGDGTLVVIVGRDGNDFSICGAMMPPHLATVIIMRIVVWYVQNGGMADGWMGGWFEG